MNIGVAIKLRILELCKIHDITINKLATISGVTQSTLNNIVSGRNNSTTVSTIKKLCDGLEISIQDFFNSNLFINLEQEVKWTIINENTFVLIQMCFLIELLKYI